LIFAAIPLRLRRKHSNFDDFSPAIFLHKLCTVHVHARMRKWQVVDIRDSFKAITSQTASLAPNSDDIHLNAIKRVAKSRILA
jgi:hypothetical protein